MARNIRFVMEDFIAEYEHKLGRKLTDIEREKCVAAWMSHTTIINGQRQAVSLQAVADAFSRAISPNKKSRAYNGKHRKARAQRFQARQAKKKRR